MKKMCPDGADGRYCTPGTKVIYINSERSFLHSGGGKDDNEHTEEEDLF